MDTSQYYITCKGKEMGPYRFYQLQQLRTNDEFVEEQFEPQEWQQLVSFLENGQIPKRATGVQKTFIRKAGERKQRKYPLLILLTYIGYLLGLGFLLGGLLQGDEDYLLRSEPMFYLGLISCVGLCFTFVDAALHALYDRVDQPGGSRVFLTYFGGLVPAIALVAITSAVAQLFLRNADITAGQVIEVGGKYLAAAALISIYLPFHFRALHDKPAPRKTHSVLWMLMPLFCSALTLLYLLPEKLRTDFRVASVRQRLFVDEGLASHSRFHWEYPIKLGDKQKTVQRRLGKPDEKNAEDYVYNFGLTISFDGRERVAKLHFDPEAEGTSEFKFKRIISGVTVQMTHQQMETLFQMESTALFSDAASETAVWGDEVYRITACFRKSDPVAANSTQATGALKWLEITRTEQ
jgi:hypothetical protein